MSEIVHCRFCNAEIIWLENVDTGKRAPLDAESLNFGGTCELVADDDGTVIGYRMLKKGELRPRGLHRPHFATCKRKPK